MHSANHNDEATHHAHLGLDASPALNAHPNAAWRLAKVAIPLALVALLACGIHSCVFGGSNNATEDTAPEQTVNTQPGTLTINDAIRSNKPLAGIPAKLQGSTESLDENGIVHGVTPDGIAYTVHGRGVLGAHDDRITLSAVGDQIASEQSLALADANDGNVGDGNYDYMPFYQEIGPLVGKSDLRYINQETVMATGGDEGFEVAGWPCFNSPDCMAQTIADVGFNMVSFTSNHSYDIGTFGIERSHRVWAQYPQLLLAGSYLTPEDRDAVHMIERNGKTFAFLAYTYGDNLYPTAADMPNSYYACAFDKDLITADVQRAQQVADAVIVCMHWGDEYTTEINDFQYEWAGLLADLDVDLVLGSHAHSMQPVEYVTGESGNTIPVVFGLSDIVSGWTITNTILSGIFSCDFVPQDDGSMAVENLLWTPTIEWSDGSQPVCVRTLAGMDEETTNANTQTPDVDDDYNYLRDMVNETIKEIPVQW